MHDSMKMVRSKSHFPILIPKDTKEDHERNITFSWNLDLLPNGAKDKSRQDGNG